MLKALLPFILIASFLTPSVQAERRVKAVIAGESVPDNILMGGNEVTGLPSVPSQGDAAASKDYIDANTGISTQSVTLAGSQTSITPDGSDRLLVNGSPASIPANVDLTVDFNDGTTVPQYAEGTATPLTDNTGGIVDGQIDVTGCSGQYLDYDGSDGNFNSTAAQNATVRVQWTPNYSDLPDNSLRVIYRTFTTGATTKALWIYHQDPNAGGNDEILACRVYATGTHTTSVSFVGGVDYVAGQPLEIECTYESFGTEFISLFVDGTRVSQFTGAISGYLDTNVGRNIELGSSASGNPNCSDSYISGLAHFSPKIRVSTDTEYNGGAPVGLPSEGTNTEIIATLVGSAYEIDEEIIVYSQDGRVQFTDSSTPDLNEMALNGTWDPNTGDWIRLRWRGSFWTEVTRSDLFADNLNVNSLVTTTVSASSGTVGGAQFRGQSTAQTTDATVTTLATFTTTSDRAYFARAFVRARQSTSPGTFGVYTVLAAVENIGGTATVSGITKAYEVEEDASWEATFDASGADLRVRVTGDGTETVEWAVDLDVFESQ